MLRRVIMFLAAVGVGLALAAGVLYLMGLRVTFTGAALPRVAFVTDNTEQARAIAAHREQQRAALEQRAGSPTAAGTPARTDSPPPLLPSTSEAPAYWTEFRGPDRDGHYRQMPVLTSWPAGGLRPLWKQPVGGGYASFAVARGRLYTIEQRGGEEVAAAYDAATGVELWTNRWRALFREAMGGDGPRATPTWSDGLVYVLGAEGEFRCLEEATGRVVWRKNILDDNGAENLQWGMAASP
jgi:outer membrane protein assembly factor BamB